MEKKIVKNDIALLELMKNREKEGLPTHVLAIHRDWLLGGQDLEWRVRRDLVTEDFILERK